MLLTKSRTILLALTALNTDCVLDWIAKNQRPSDNFVLLNVRSDPFAVAHEFARAGMYSDEAVSEFNLKTEVESNELLREATLKLEEFGKRNVVYYSMCGDPGPTIIEFSEKISADLIVLGNRHAGAVERFFAGSVSDYLLRHSKLPIQMINVK
jgi:nucleotide-binding universal stress UspA family protein